MTSALQLGVVAIQLNDYAAVVILVVVGYDYFLTFSSEIEYVWNRRWTWISTLFVLVRYVGLCNVVASAFLESSFLPVPAKVISYYRFSVKVLIADGRSILLYIISIWASFIFFVALDLVTTLRVWVVCHHSRAILALLLTLFAIKIIPYLVYCVLVSLQDEPLVVADQALLISFRVELQRHFIVWISIIYAIQATLSALMCLLVTTQLVKQLIQIHKATQRFQLDSCVELLARQNILCFVFILANTIIEMILIATDLPTDGWYMILIMTIQSIAVFTLAPRFILSLRALHGHESNVDTAFGLTSQLDRISTIVFADPPNEGMESSEEIPMKENSGL